MSVFAPLDTEMVVSFDEIRSALQSLNVQATIATELMTQLETSEGVHGLSPLQLNTLFDALHLCLPHWLKDKVVTSAYRSHFGNNFLVVVLDDADISHPHMFP